MGKYFKDNNQRTSKASQSYIESLSERAIRTAAPLPPIPPAVKQLGGKIKGFGGQIFNRFLKPTTLENRSSLLSGELGYLNQTTGEMKAIQPGKAPGAYAAGSFLPGAQGVSKLLKAIPGVGPTLAKGITALDFITAGEKYFPEVGRLLGQRYLVTDLNAQPPAPSAIPLTLKQILEGLDANGIVTIGNRDLSFSEANITRILADMQSLDEYAKKWAKIKAIASASGISVYEAFIEWRASQPGQKASREKAKQSGQKASRPPASGTTDSSKPQTREQFDEAAQKKLKDMFPGN